MNTIQNKHILKSMPLMASILGDKYGVEVSLGGSTAMTDGKNIILPSLPLECDDTFLGLLRGFIDHESAHIRYTDFGIVQNEKLTQFEHFVWNCIEDWRIEQKMAKHFAGCKGNFYWLINHVFVKEKKKNTKLSVENALAEWLLLSIRSWDVEALKPQVLEIEQHINTNYPKLAPLLGELSYILSAIKIQCESTKDALVYAKAIVACIANYIELLSNEVEEHNNNEEGENEDGEQNQTNGHSAPTAQPNREGPRGNGEDDSIAGLRSLLAGNSCSVSSEDERLRELIESIANKEHASNTFSVAKVGYKSVNVLSQSAIERSLRVSTTLKARLQGLLQAQQLARVRPARHGKINKSKLHGLAVNNPKAFLQEEKRVGTNTAIHILLDTSASMQSRIQTACEACFALAKSLENMKGISVGVTSFPAKGFPLPSGQRPTNSVYPLVKQGEKVGANFKLLPDGSTPLTEALWWLYPLMLAQKEERKIILLITDGEPDDKETAIQAIEFAQKIGLEIYGIGIAPCIIENILPERGLNIQVVEELPQTLFGLLQSTLL